MLTLLLAAALSTQPPENAVLRGELGATVLSVSPEEITLAIIDPYVPRRGDPVELFRLVQDTAIPAGRYTITYAEGDLVRASPEPGSPPAQIGMPAIVHSALPSGVISKIGFLQTTRPSVPLEDSIAWTRRHSDLAARASASYNDALRLLADTPPNPSRAATLLREAARLNHLPAILALLPLDPADAPFWLRRAAELGHRGSQLALSRSLSGEAARAWSRKAAANPPKP